jgi:NitT/TauT family transport system ATP-binding protein
MHSAKMLREPSLAHSAPAAGVIPAVEILSAEKVFANGARGLAPIDLTIEEGEFLSLIGPSGCGKSTLLSLIANLTEPTDGRILWWRGGFDRIGQEGRRLSFVFQDPTLMPWARVETNVRLPLDLADMPKADARPKVERALALVGLSDYARHYPRQLSGGMRMRVSIARSLVKEPNMLLMDEPFGALDEFTRNRLDADLAALWASRRFSVAFVTHSIYEAVFLSTRIVVMAAEPGRIFREIAIDEPHPRGAAFRTTPQFADYCRALSVALMEASLASGTAFQAKGAPR